MVQAARDALVAVRVVGVKVYAGPAVDTGVQFRGIEDRLLVRVDHTRLGGAVGVDEVGILISLIALAVLVAVTQRGLQVFQRGHELAVTLELALALFVGRLNRGTDLGDGHGVGLRDEAQIEHYTEFIGNHPGWELAGIYADDGISGTNTKKREEFNRLIDDCMAGQIDMVVTKSISRFARNTLDCLKYIRQLKDKNIPVFFEKEAINTLDAKGEVLLTIMASLAQQESQSLSQNVRLGLQYRYQQGKVQVCTNRFLGYDKDEDGNLVINPEEAEVVKRIYREYLEGKSYYAIGQGLTADGIRTAAGSDYWLASTLKKILTNEKYIGDALLQKTVTTDFLNKKRVANKGIVPQYYVENSHEAIIPRDLFLQVQEEMVRRARLETGTGKRRVYSGKFVPSCLLRSLR